MYPPSLVDYQPIVCRPALPKDTPGMFELTRWIWEGDDYIPDVWEAWLADTQGILAVAEWKGKVVGFAKLTKLSAGDWWMEGLRVHPKFEGNRIASRLHGYLLEFWQRYGSGVLRLATSSAREPVKHLSRKWGFETIGEYSIYKSEKTVDNFIDAQHSPFQRFTLEDIPDAITWLKDPQKDRLPFGIMDLGWQFAEPKEEYFVAYLQGNQAWWWEGQQGILLMVDKKDGEETWARIRMLACDREKLAELLHAVRKFTNQSGYAGVNWMAPMLPGMEEVLVSTGFKRDWEGSLLIFEKRQAQG